MLKKEHIRERARGLHKMRSNYHRSQGELNQLGFTTSYGTEYVGGRGIYKLISAVHKWLVSIGELLDAEMVALAFTQPDGNYAFN